MPVIDIAEGPPKGIFLSYSSRDRAAALKLKGGLEQLGVAVRLDVEAMQPGQGIRNFIVESIRSTCATVLVVSEASLLSEWVAFEVFNSLVQTELFSARKFIACYLDAGFLNDDFLLRANRTIEAKIGEINAGSAARAAESLDTVDLNAQRTRLYDLRNMLGKLLARLRDELCLDLRDDQFTFNVQRLASALRPLVPVVAPPPLNAASNIETRAKEIYELVENADGDRALKRIMDFLHDFSTDKRRVRKITVAIGEFRSLEKERGRSLKELHAVRKSILGGALELLDDTIDALSMKVA